MESNQHGLLDIMQHIWPYIAAFFASLVAMVKMAMMDRKNTLMRIKKVELLAYRLATKDDLHSCRDAVNRQCEEAEIKRERADIRISDKIDKLISDNNRDHMELSSHNKNTN
jgi:hypothetical protein